MHLIDTHQSMLHVLLYTYSLNHLTPIRVMCQLFCNEHSQDYKGFNMLEAGWIVGETSTRESGITATTRLRYPRLLRWMRQIALHFVEVNKVVDVHTWHLR